jgi:phosphotriesterase-related protein
VIVRTVLGDIAPDVLGFTLSHEHVFARPPADVTDSDFHLDDEARSVAELARFRTVGGSAIVEMTTRDYGNDPAALARISRAAGVHVIAATGFNKGKFANRISSGMTTAEIAAWMIGEVQSGVAGTTVRAGLIKVASGLNGPGADERRVFEAAAEGHRATGVPISTHTEKGTWADGQIALLTSLGVAPNRMLIGHLDLKPDLGYLREVAEAGVFLGFDQFSKAKYLADSARIDLIAHLAEEGHHNQIVISGDLARRSYLTAWGGGPGYRYFLTDLMLQFAERGISEALYRSFAVANPRRLFAFTPL